MLLHKISKLKSDPNIVDAINSSDCVEDNDSSSSYDLGDTYTFAEDIDDNGFESTKRLSSFKKRFENNLLIKSMLSTK